MFCCENIMRYSNGAFIRRFCWDIEKIIPSETNEKTGYIVQRIERSTTGSCEQYSLKSGEKHNAYNHSYWEAWKIDNGTISLPNIGYNDSWECMPQGWGTLCSDYNRLVAMLHLFCERYETNGCISMKGTVYWAPENSELFRIVKDDFNNSITYARQLPASWEMPLPQNSIYIGTHSFSCSWDLRNAEIFKKSVMSYIYTCKECDNVEDAIKASFEKEHLQKMILEEYKNIHQAINENARKQIIETPQALLGRTSYKNTH